MSEYVLILGAAILAIFSIKTLVARGYQARIKSTADLPVKLVQQAPGLNHIGLQYEPYYYQEESFFQSQGNTKKWFNSSEQGMAVNTISDNPSNVFYGIDISADDQWDNDD